MILTVQEQHLPGRDLEEQFATARSWGFDGIELRGKGDFAFERRLPELQRARANGVVMPTVCVEMDHFVGAFDADQRRDAIAQLGSQLAVMGELGGLGAITPASYGMFSTRLPPFVPPRSPDQDTEVLIEGLTELGDRAAAAGVELYLEPLNRYEDHMVNRLDQAVSLLRKVNRPAVKIVADTYHMNIEEADPWQALREAGDWIGHLQPSDSNRLEPGAGHLDWAGFADAVRDLGYDRTLAVESRLSAPAAESLPRAAALLRRQLG